MFKHGYRYDEAEAEVAGYKIPLGIAILGSSLRQEANARVAIRRKRSFACFISFYLLFRAAKLRKRKEKASGTGGKVGAEGESLNKCSGFGAILFIRAGGCDVYRLVGRLRCAGS